MCKKDGQPHWCSRKWMMKDTEIPCHRSQIGEVKKHRVRQYYVLSRVEHPKPYWWECKLIQELLEAVCPCLVVSEFCLPGGWVGLRQRHTCRKIEWALSRVWQVSPTDSAEKPGGRKWEMHDASLRCSVAKTKLVNFQEMVYQRHFPSYRRDQEFVQNYTRCPMYLWPYHSPPKKPQRNLHKCSRSQVQETLSCNFLSSARWWINSGL